MDTQTTLFDQDQDQEAQDKKWYDAIQNQISAQPCAACGEVTPPDDLTYWPETRETVCRACLATIAPKPASDPNVGKYYRFPKRSEPTTREHWLAQS